MKNQTSQESLRECTKYEPLKNSTLIKYRWKTKLFTGFIKNVLSIDFWKIPTLGKYRWKSKLLKSFIEKVPSVDLWKISRLENINERSIFSRVSSRMYKVWTFEKFHTYKISMKDQTFHGFHRKCTKCGPLKNSTLMKYRWKTKLFTGFMKIVLDYDL